MIKGLLTTLSLLALSLTAFAQNLQLHFDPRHAFHGDNVSDRNYFTATFEMFKPDKWGSTFLFVDLDFNQSRGNVGTAYMEIARDFKLGKCPVMAHIEYNGGVGKSENFGFSVPNAYMGGISYATRIGDVNLSTYLVYKYNAFSKISHDVQWTGIWGVDLFGNKVTLSGFLDIWTEDKQGVDASGKKIILLTEPQFWYNITPHFSLGSEIEISNNFILSSNKALINPTIAAKWNF